MNRIYRSASFVCIFAFGLFAGYVISNMRMTATAKDGVDGQPLQVIVNAAAQGALIDANHCEFANTTDAPKVKDFLSSYLKWSFNKSPHGFSNIKCTGNRSMQCEWSFGEERSLEGWSRTLTFRFDVATQSIHSTGIACHDIP